MDRHTLSRPFLIGLAATAIATCVAGYILHEEHRPQILEIYIFSLKGSRAIFIRTPDDQRVLVNGGPNSEVIKHITEVLPFYSRHIDVIVATDDDPKNVTGLIDVLDRYDVGRAYIPRYTAQSAGVASSTDPITQIFRATLEEKQIHTREISAGDQIRISGPEDVAPGMVPPVTLHALFPVDPSGFGYSKASPPQIVFTIEHGDNRFTFIDDASMKVQKSMVSATTTKQIFDTAGPNSVLITSKAGKVGDIASELVSVIRPSQLVFEQTTPVKQRAVSTTKVQKKPDPLAGILMDHRFNLRVLKMVRILSGGMTVKIENPD